MSTMTITMTLPQQSATTTATAMTPQPVQATAPLFLSTPGKRLGQQQLSLPSRRLSVTTESITSQKIEALMVQGREAKIKAFISKLKTLPIIHTDAWIVSFEKIDPQNKRKRAFCLAILLFRELQPALVKNQGLQEQKALLECQQSCHRILKQLLPAKEPLEAFLQSSQIWLEEEKLWRKQCAKADRVSKILQEELVHVCQAIDEKIENSNTLLKKELNVLQQQAQLIAQEKVLLTSEVDALQRQVKRAAKTESPLLLKAGEWACLACSHYLDFAKF